MAKKKPRKPKGRADSFTAKVRRALGDYVRSEGCSCCRDNDAHEAAAAVLAKLLHVPPYSDGSGHDFYRFATPREVPHAR